MVCAHISHRSERACRRIIEFGRAKEFWTPRIASGDQHLAVREQRRRVSARTAHVACGCKGPRRRIIKFIVSPNYQDSAVIEQGGYPTPGREHGACRGEGSCGRVVKFGACQSSLSIASAGSQDLAVREQSQSASRARRNHFTRWSKGASRRIIELRAGQGLE